MLPRYYIFHCTCLQGARRHSIKLHQQFQRHSWWSTHGHSSFPHAADPVAAPRPLGGTPQGLPSSSGHDPAGFLVRYRRDDSDYPTGKNCRTPSSWLRTGSAGRQPTSTNFGPSTESYSTEPSTVNPPGCSSIVYWPLWGSVQVMVPYGFLLSSKGIYSGSGCTPPPALECPSQKRMHARWWRSMWMLVPLVVGLCVERRHTTPPFPHTRWTGGMS